MGQVERHPMRPAESRIYREFHNNGFGRIICPACNKAFQGENADQNYRQHWKERHALNPPRGY